jgi:hypothetical protein
MTQRTCLDCGTPISVKSKGRCRSCNCAAGNSDPKRRAKASASMKRRLADPAERERQAELTRAGVARYLADPQNLERRRELGRVYGAPNIEATRSAESRAKAGRAISAVKLAHIPARFRDEYSRLKTKGLTKAERTMIVEWLLAQERREARETIARFLKEQRARAVA